MSLFPKIVQEYQHYKPSDYASIEKARPALAKSLEAATYGDKNATYTEKHLPGNGEDTFGVLARSGPDAFTLTVAKASGRVLATADLQAGNDLFENFAPAKATAG